MTLLLTLYDGLNFACRGRYDPPAYTTKSRALAPCWTSFTPSWRIPAANCGSRRRSRDGTAEAVLHHRRQPDSYPVIALRHHANRITAPSRQAYVTPYDILCITDADGTYPNERIPDLLARLEEGADMVWWERFGDRVRIRRCAAQPNGLSDSCQPRGGREILISIPSAHLPSHRRNGVLRHPARRLLLHYDDSRWACSPTATWSSPIDYHARAGKSKIRLIKTRAQLRPVDPAHRLFAPLSSSFLPLSMLLWWCWG